VADGPANLPRQTLAASQKERRVAAPQHEVVHLISSLTAATSPQALLRINRDHWGIEIMHRNKDVILGEDGYTNRCDNAPRNIFSLTGFVLKILKSVSSSPTRAIERFQDDRKKPRNPPVLGFLLNRPAGC
jgi:predicted transposase YbfD/YdcC